MRDMSRFVSTGGRETKARNVIILLGGPGAGKGTQAEGITRWLGFPHISTGQLLRSQVAVGTALGLRAKAIMETGGLVGDDLVNEIVAERIRKEDCEAGFILDGYPRNVRQAIAFEGSLPLSARQTVIDIAIDPEKLIPRLTQRRTCRSCGAIYHLITSLPKRGGFCDECGDALIQRADDREEVIRERFRVYVDRTQELTRFYRRMRIYHQVDGTRPREQVAGDIRELLEQEVWKFPPAASFAFA
jgi:adenylate kinase